MNGDNTSANAQSYRHHLIPAAYLVEVFGQRPRGCVGIVRLNGCTAPRRAAVGISEQFAVTVHDGDHDGIVDETAQHSAVNLSKEHDTRRDLDYTDRLASKSTDETNERLRYSPIFRSLHRLTQLEMTLCDQAAKYMLPTGRPGMSKPANIFDRLFVAMPLPYRAYSIVLYCNVSYFPRLAIIVCRYTY